MVVAIIYEEKNDTGMTVDPMHVEMVRQALPGAEVYLAYSGEEMSARGVEADILIIRTIAGRAFIAKDYIMSQKNLRWIHGLTAGVEGVTGSEIAKIPNLILSNSTGIHGVPISEHVLGVMIYHYHGYERNRVNQQNHRWERFFVSELSEKTLSILGMGNIAGEIAKRAKAFGMTVLGVKRTVQAIENVDEVFPPERMDEAIARADTLVMLLPETDKTARIMDAEKFALMKDDAFFINVGRASTVETDALIDALKSGKLSGAALDVFDTEPLPADHPIWDVENVFITTHMSSISPHYMQRAFKVFQDNAPFFLRGERLPTQVDIDKY